MARHWRYKTGKEKTQRPVYEHKPWNSHLVMESIGAGHVSYGTYFNLTEKLQWVSKEDPGFSRIPQEKQIHFRCGSGFTAAGKYYKELSQLRVKKAAADSVGMEEILAACNADQDYYRLILKMASDNSWYEDIHGREVFYVTQRMYPALDEFDAMHDHRSHRWCFLREAGKLTRVYWNDESPIIYVTEDVAEVEYEIWKKMKDAHYFG